MCIRNSTTEDGEYFSNAPAATVCLLPVIVLSCFSAMLPEGVLERLDMRSCHLSDGGDRLHIHMCKGSSAFPTAGQTHKVHAAMCCIRTAPDTAFSSQMDTGTCTTNASHKTIEKQRCS